MKTYKVLVPFGLDGKNYKVGQSVDLTDEQAEDLGKKVRLA